MSVKLECDRCGDQEQTGSVMLFAGTCGPGIPTARPELPAGWARPRLPTEDDELRDRELCPQCRADLLRFMAGAVLAPDEADACADCGHVHPGAVCRALTMPGAPGDVDECGCREGASANPPDPMCPDCQHLRHGDACPDHIPGVGPCGCERRASRELLKELGIDG
jgi:hypothetical protein